MADRGATIFACSCEGTMSLDGDALARGCGGRVDTADQLCRAELGRFKAALAAGGDIIVGCTQEAPLFEETAAETAPGAVVRFTNLRETGGWSREGAAAGPKMAALLTAARVPLPDVPFVTLESRGVTLVYGRDEVAVDVARRLADHLDVTVLLHRPGDVPPPRRTDYPVLKGTIATARGHLGAFALTVNDYALPSPSSRDRLRFGPARDGATSTCDLIVDVSGGTPLFPAHEVRPGYLRADPRDPAAVERLIGEASHLVDTFDKPRYIGFQSHLCAHSRSRITGCTRCLDLCPTGAITPAGDHVAIDPAVCAGCGQCASVCPTGAAAYALPPVETLVTRLRALLDSYDRAGGRDAVVLFHDGEHGADLVDALARFGDGLPARVIPLAVNEITQIGPELLASAVAYGAAGIRILTRARPRHDITALARALDTTGAVLAGYGYGEAVLGLVQTDDPDALSAALVDLPVRAAATAPARFLPVTDKRTLLGLAFRELHRAAPLPADVVPLAAGAPFGTVNVNTDGCTLCLACVSACPVDALTDNPEQPMLRFTEANCVQCGLCASTCPERVISLEPRLSVPAWEAGKRVVKEEEPFCCTQCGKPFGTRSTIERVIQRLEGRHWMFAGDAGLSRTRVLRMCEDCRVEVVVNESFDPHTSIPRPPIRTAEDV